MQNLHGDILAESLPFLNNLRIVLIVRFPYKIILTDVKNRTAFKVRRLLSVTFSIRNFTLGCV